MPRRKISPEEKEKLDNTKVPSVTLKGALKAYKAGDAKEADRLWNLVKDHERERKHGR